VLIHGYNARGRQAFRARVLVDALTPTEHEKPKTFRKAPSSPAAELGIQRQRCSLNLSFVKTKTTASFEPVFCGIRSLTTQYRSRYGHLPCPIHPSALIQRRWAERCEHYFTVILRTESGTRIGKLLWQVGDQIPQDRS
jgi:hypothetical protein